MLIMDNDDYARKLLSSTRVCAFCAVVVMLLLVGTAIILVPRALTAIDNLNQVTANLNAVDWKGLVDNVDKVADSLEKFNLDQLAQIIEDLQNAIAPLTSLFGG